MIKQLWLLSSYWTALPVAKKDSLPSESSPGTRNISSDPDMDTAEIQAPVRALPQDQQAVIPVQPGVQAPQHCSSFPATLDSTHILPQHNSTASMYLPLHCPPPPPQPPSYAQSLAKSHFCYSEEPPEPPAYNSSIVVTQPLRAPWRSVSTGSSTASNGQPGQVLRRIQSFTSTTPSCGAASSIPSAMQIYSQKLSRPASTGQGKATVLPAVSALCNPPSCANFCLLLLWMSVIRRSSSSKLKSNSVGTFKELNPLSAQSNQQAFISALQKLADKQVARHYASSGNINLLTQHVSSWLFFSISGSSHLEREVSPVLKDDTLFSY